MRRCLRLNPPFSLSSYYEMCPFILCSLSFIVCLRHFCLRHLFLHYSLPPPVMAPASRNKSSSLHCDEFVKPTIGLPAKTLPLHGSYLGFCAMATFTTAFLVCSYLVLCSIHNWQPDRDSLTLDVDNIFSTACDLITSNSSFIENVFAIDLRVPREFSFGTAKGVDVVWDFSVGQGGRLLLAWISYKVFMDGLARLMETSPVSYQLYAKMVFETTSLSTTWHCARAVFTRHGWRGRAFLAWFIVATVYVLGFSTLMSAATGYVGSTTAAFLMHDKDFVSTGSSQISNCYNITPAPYPDFLEPAEPPIIGPSILDFNLLKGIIRQQSDMNEFNTNNRMYMTLYNSQ